MSATIGDNQPPSPADLFDPRLAALNAKLVDLLAKELTAQIAAALRDLVKAARDLETDLEAAKKSDKQPHLDANAAIESAYRPLVSGAGELKAEARRVLDAFLKAEEDQRIRDAAEARRLAAEAEQRAAELAAEAEEDPFAEHQADEADHEARLATIAADHMEQRADAGASVRGLSGARAAVLRSYFSVKVVDPKKMVAHFSSDPDVIAAATKAANAVARATKGAMDIPGCEIVEDRRSA